MNKIFLSGSKGVVNLIGLWDSFKERIKKKIEIKCFIKKVKKDCKTNNGINYTLVRKLCDRHEDEKKGAFYDKLIKQNKILSVKK